MTDTTTPEQGPEPQKAKLLRFGLSNGQTIIVLAQEPVERDIDMLVIQTTSGDEVRICEDHILWTRSSEVDMPTEDEISAYAEKLYQKSVVSPNEARAVMGLMDSQGPYL